MSTSWKLSELISLNAGDEGRLLSLELPVGLLLDTERCHLIQRQIHDAAAGGAWEVLPATPASGSSVPRSPGVYMFVWRPPLTLTRHEPHDSQQLLYVLYVGRAGGPDSSSTLHQRYKNYIRYFASDPKSLWSNQPLDSRDARMKCFLSLEPLEYWFLSCAATSTIHEIEARLQSVLNPPLNARRERVLRAGPSRKAF